MFLSRVSVLAILFGVFFSTSVYGSGGFIPSEQEIVDVLGKVQIQQIPSTPDNWGLVGQSTKVAGWSASSSYTVMHENEIEYNLHIYETTLPSVQEAEELLKRALQEISDNESFDRGMIFPLELEQENEQFIVLFILFEQEGLKTISFVHWIRVDEDLVMLELTKSFSGEYTENISSEGILVPITRLVFKKIAEVGQLKMI